MNILSLIQQFYEFFEFWYLHAIYFEKISMYFVQTKILRYSIFVTCFVVFDILLLLLMKKIFKSHQHLFFVLSQQIKFFFKYFETCWFNRKRVTIEIKHTKNEFIFRTKSSKLLSFTLRREKTKNTTIIVDNWNASNRWLKI